MSESDLTTITLTKETRDRLKSYGNKGETWNATTNRILNELDMARKENIMLLEIRELIFGPIKHHMMESTKEEIDQLELGDEFHSEFDDRLKRFWKRFAKDKDGNTIMSEQWRNGEHEP